MRCSTTRIRIPAKYSGKFLLYTSQGAEASSKFKSAHLAEPGAAGLGHSLVAVSAHAVILLAFLRVA